MQPLSPGDRAAAKKLIAAVSAFVPDGRTSLFDTFTIVGQRSSDG